MKITTIGIDLAKLVFQVHGVDERGKTALRRQLKRGARSCVRSHGGMPTTQLVHPSGAAQAERKCAQAHVWFPPGLAFNFFKKCPIVQGQ